MHTNQTRADQARFWRTGPVGRAARVLYAAVFGAAVYGLSLTGITNFSDPEVLAQTGFWLITVAMVKAAYDLPAQLFGPIWGRRALTALFSLAATAGVVATVATGTPWAAPLTWLVFLVDLAVPTIVALAMVTSAVFGTRGCEFGAITELFDRLSGTYDPEDRQISSCAVGLHRIDAWEVRQPWRQRGNTAERHNGHPSQASIDLTDQD